MQITGHRSQHSCFKTLPKDIHSEILTYFNPQDLDQIKSVNRCFHKESTEFLKKFIDGAIFLLQPKSRSISFRKKISDKEEIRYEFQLQISRPLCDGSYSDIDYDSSDEDEDNDYDPIAVNKENINNILMISSFYGCTQAIRLLLLHEDANINFPDEGGSPLYDATYFATQTNSFSAVRFLLKHGADVNNIQGIDGTDGKSPLIHAIEVHHLNLELIKLLLQHGANPNHLNKDAEGDLNKTPLCIAIARANLELVKLLLDYRADPNQMFFSFKKDSSIIGIVNPLIRASESGNEEITKILLERGADIKQLIQRHGLDPLIPASAYGNVPILKLLLENGSDVNSKFTPPHIPGLDLDGMIAERTALHMAVQNGHLEAVQFLIENHADINAKERAGFTPFHLAILSAVSVSFHICISTKRIRVIQYLLSFSGLKVTEFPSQFGMETLRSCIRREADRFGPDILSVIQQRMTSDESDDQ